MSSQPRTQSLAQSFALTPGVPPPPATGPASPPVIERAGGPILLRARDATLAPGADPAALVRYAAALVTVARACAPVDRAPLHAELGAALHALAHAYERRATQPPPPPPPQGADALDEAALRRRLAYQLAQARALHLATHAFATARAAAPWDAALPALVDLAARATHAHLELPDGRAAATVAAVYAAAKPPADPTPLFELAVHVNQAHWESARLLQAAPTAPTDHELGTLALSHLQRQFDTMVRHHSAAAARLDEALLAAARHAAAKSDAGRAVVAALQASCQRVAAERDRVIAVDARRRARLGARVPSEDDAGVLARAPLELAAPVEPAPEPAPAAVFDLDQLLLTESDAWSGSFVAPPRAAPPTNPPTRTLTSVLARVLDVPESTLVTTARPRVADSWRLALLAAVRERERWYASGHGGPDRLHQMRALQTARERLLKL